MERMNNVLGKTQRCQLTRTVFQALPDVILVDIKFQRKISFDGTTLTITRRVGVCPICHANFGCCHYSRAENKVKKRQKTDQKKIKTRKQIKNKAKKKSPFQG